MSERDLNKDESCKGTLAQLSKSFEYHLSELMEITNTLERGGTIKTAMTMRKHIVAADGIFSLLVDSGINQKHQRSTSPP